MLSKPTAVLIRFRSLYPTVYLVVLSILPKVCTQSQATNLETDAQILQVYDSTTMDKRLLSALEYYKKYCW